MTVVREPAVAGQFYPEEPEELRALVNRFIEDAACEEEAAPKALIAPHAGYVYSGPVAGSAYAALAKTVSKVNKVVLIGPAHWVPVRGLAASSAEAFVTPLGVVPLDDEARGLRVHAAGHARRADDDGRRTDEAPQGKGLRAPARDTG